MVCCKRVGDAAKLKRWGGVEGGGVESGFGTFSMSLGLVDRDRKRLLLRTCMNFFCADCRRCLNFGRIWVLKCRKMTEKVGEPRIK